MKNAYNELFFKGTDYIFLSFYHPTFLINKIEKTSPSAASILNVKYSNKIYVLPQQDTVISLHSSTIDLKLQLETFSCQ